MPTAPTLVSLTTGTGTIIVTYVNTGTGDHNQLWRSTSSEYAGAFILIADPLPYDTSVNQTFTDSNVASEKSYVYKVTSVDVSGNTADSTTAQTSVMLSTGFLHSVKKGTTVADIINAVSSVAVLDLIPHSRSYGLAATEYLTAGADIPTIGVSAIEQVGVDITIKIPQVSDANRAIIRAMVSSRRYICYRDTRGNKFFGTMAYDERYNFNTDLSLHFTVLEFSESVAAETTLITRTVNGYTAAQIDRALRELDLPQLVRVRAELLDLDNMLLFSLSGLLGEGAVAHNVKQPMQRGADLRLLETVRDSQHPSPLGTFAATILAQSPAFWLRCNETSGNFADSSGNSRTFTANGSFTYSIGALGAGDLADNAVTLNGTTAYASIADAAWMDVTALTLMIACRGTGTSDTLIDRNDGGSNRMWRLEVNSSGYASLTINFTTGSITTFATTTLINDGRAHLIHAIYDGANVMIVVDGKRVLKTAETRVMQTGALAINVGRNLAAANFYAGTLDEVVMIGRALSAKEIRDSYQAWSGQTTELLIDRDRGDRVKVYYGVRMAATGTDGTDTAEWPQIVAILTSPKKGYTETGVILSIQCQDQCRVLQDYTLSSVITLASGANYITGTGGVLAIAALAGLNTAGWAVTATALTAPADIPFEIGASALDSINYLLDAINYKHIRFSGSGAAVIEPNVLDRNLPLVDAINSTTMKVIEAANLTLELEPRKVIREVIVGNGNPDVAPLRGIAQSVIFAEGESLIVQVDVPDQTTADNLAAQLLADGIAETARRIRFRTLPRPIHDDRERYDLTMPEIGINTAEAFIEEAWNLPLNGGTMDHSMLSVVAVS